ncbi:MAG: P-II family nitrogen regulator [Clostridia bacterium]|nr:P-II family nitrogen regulator [Clostridia bacterium]
MTNNFQYDLIVTIVNKGFSEKIIQSSRKAGAHGGTIIHGRGTGIHEDAKIFGISIEPEKEVILTLIKKDLTEVVLEAIMAAGELKKPGKGIAFVLDISKVAGISHIT